MIEDEFNEYMDHMKRYLARQVKYCQRCEEPRSLAEFLPQGPSVCIHCIREMRPAEMVWFRTQVLKRGGL
jgi:hypothetical protein